MKDLVNFLLTTHPAGGWLKKNGSEEKRKRKSGKDGKSPLSPDGFHSRSSVTKRNNPRYNPAP